ncbi:MFS transporter, ACS family, allantoate permease [Entomortierella parvispora]|uniref:MFS transporter, ACS family, allantoate permease n=1 Tax=Entomortierella parvispora TaxID=205924 RepID=A0A9P3LZ33_9FUNG|nr:MFS transporter, ACS family, allantoate permease [Entomortierella parvispora]
MASKVPAEYASEKIDEVDAEGAYNNHTAELDPVAVGKLRRKIDLHLIPLISVLYLCSFLDRVNIGNAKVAGLASDIVLTANEYNWALSIFFIGYVIFEIPSNILLKKIGPRKWITIIMIFWGTIMMSMAAVTNAAGLLAARFFLGLTESGLFPGSVYLISLWYTRSEQALRNGLFFSTATMAGAFGGVLAYGIAQMEGVRGLHGWQWIFILEGLPTVLLTIVVFFYLPDFPATAPFLNQEEKELADRRLVIDAGPATQTEFSWKQFRSVFVDWKVYMHMITYILSATPLYSLSLFLPSIVQGFNFSPLTTQAMTAPAYVIACLFTILCAFSSDRFRERGIHYAFPTVIGCLGYILLIVTKDSHVVNRYVSLTVAASGVFAAVPPMLSWFTTNIGGHTKRGVATAAIISFGNIGGAIGGQIYRASDAADGYVRGHTICAVMMGLSAVLVMIMKYGLIRENRRRDNLTPEEFAREAEGDELCDHHPGFRYYS